MERELYFHGSILLLVFNRKQIGRLRFNPEIDSLFYLSSIVQLVTKNISLLWTREEILEVFRITLLTSIYFNFFTTSVYFISRKIKRNYKNSLTLALNENT